MSFENRGSDLPLRSPEEVPANPLLHHRTPERLGSFRGFERVHLHMDFDERCGCQILI